MTAAKLLKLTARELDVCVMHLVEGHSQTQIAEWLDLGLRTIQREIENAVTKVPELAPLLVHVRTAADKPVIVHLSQLSKRDKKSGPFNPDEL